MATVSFPSKGWVRDVGPIEGITPVVWHPDNPPPDGPLDVVVAPYVGAAACIASVDKVPGVRLVQLLTAGFDGIFERVPDRIAIANAAGVHDDSTAELALAMILASQRGIPDFVRAQERGVWLRPGFLPSLADRRVLVLGYGGVGRAIVERLLPFRARVSVVATTARDGDDLVKRVGGMDELDRLLKKSEVVILAVPLNDTTRGLADDAFLSKLPDNALVVNIARGPVLDTDAALHHTDRLRFALDVTDPEPLPPEHPLWQAPGVLITPHVGGPSTAFRPRAVEMLREQLGRIGRGEAPDHIVRPAAP
ncbi:2-hydroxyacid dehydrogenase [Nostocoides australiense]